MKKIIVTLLAMMLVVSSLTVTSFAQEEETKKEPILSIQTQNVQKGSDEEIEVQVYLKNNPGVVGGIFYPKFDTTKLRFVEDYEYEEASGKSDENLCYKKRSKGLNYFDVCEYTPASNNFTFSAKDAENVYGDGLLVTFYLEWISGSAEVGYFPFTLEASKDPGNCLDEEGPITYAVKDGAIAVNSEESYFESYSITANEDLTLNTTAIVDNSITTPKTLFTKDGKTTTVEGTLVDGKYNFSYEGILAHQMSDEVIIQLIDDDEKVVATQFFTVKDYCDKLYSETPASLNMSQEKYDALLELLANLLNYGASAQVYTGFQTYDPANDLEWVADEAEAYTITSAVDAKSVTVTSTDSNNRIKNAMLRVGSSVIMKFQIDCEDAKAEDTYLKVTNDGITKTYRVSEMEKVKDEEGVAIDNLYEIQVLKLAATEFDNTVNATLSYIANKANVTLHAIDYSVYSYCYAKKDSLDTNLKDIVAQIYNYGVSAENYISK